MEVFIFGRWWRSHQSLAHEGPRIPRFCIVVWKGEREPTVKHCMGEEIDVFQKFTRIHSLGQNWWRANGIRVEYFPMHFCNKVQEFLSKWVKNQKNLQSGSSSCRCSTTSHGDLQTMNRNANQAPTSSISARRFSSGRWSFFGLGWCVSFRKKDFQQDVGHSSDLGQKQSGILLTTKDHKENDRVEELMMIKFS